MTTVGSIIPRLLAGHGVTTVFGIPGVQTLELFRGIPEAGLRHVLTRSEQGAAFAADGYARTTGRPGVCLLISGPGLTNAATAIAQAHHDSTPLLIVSAAPPTHAVPGSGALHLLPDQHALMRTITRASHHVTDAAALPGILAGAFASFAAARPGPIHIEVPADLLGHGAPALEPARIPAAPPVPGDDDLDAAARLLEAAEAPAILAGGGAQGASAELTALAERLGAPVALTVNGKGALPDAHPLSLSTTLPSDATLDLLDEADVVLAVGTEFSEVDVYYGGRGPALPRRLVRIDIDLGQMARPREPDVALVGDSTAVLQALAQRLPEAPAADRGAARAAAARDAVAWWPRAAPLLPLVAAIGEALPDDALVASDSTQLGYLGQHVWPAQRPRSWMVPAGWGTLGYALPMAIGAAVAAPDRPAICVVGDGGLLFTVGEMATAADLGRQLLMLLWNNGGYQEMRDEYDELGIAPHVGTDAAARDHALIAGGFGWEALRPSRPGQVGDTIRRALAADHPVLVELTPGLL